MANVVIVMWQLTEVMTGLSVLSSFWFLAAYRNVMLLPLGLVNILGLCHLEVFVVSIRLFYYLLYVLYLLYYLL